MISNQYLDIDTKSQLEKITKLENKIKLLEQKLLYLENKDINCYINQEIKFPTSKIIYCILYIIYYINKVYYMLRYYTLLLYFVIIICYYNMLLY
jgi:hypothetical protein